MKKTSYNTEDINAYLLGSLTEAETELFDELSFTDEDFIAQVSAAENDLVDAFVNGELTGEKLDKFESFYLASPLRREKTEFARSFQIFAEKGVAEDPARLKQTQTHDVEDDKPNRGLAVILSDFFSVPRLSMQWGFALATLALIVFGGWLFVENSRLRTRMSRTQNDRDDLLERKIKLEQREKSLQELIAEKEDKSSVTEKELAVIRREREKLEEELKRQKSSGQRQVEQLPPPGQLAKARKQPPANRPPISISSFILIPARRGGDQLQTLAIPADTDMVEMRLELESDDFSVYQVFLRAQSGNGSLWQSKRLKPNGGRADFLKIRFPAKLLESKIYSLEVTGFSADGAVENTSGYSFRVVR